MRRIGFGTKAETLHRLGPVLTEARILPLRYFSCPDWRRDREGTLRAILDEPWAGDALIVRSSAESEDSAAGSQAGRFRTLPGLRGRSELAAGIDAVVASYGTERPGDQVLVQPQLADSVLSGVACSIDPSSGAPYLVVNWVDGPATDVVTAGRAGGLRTWYGSAGGGSATLPQPLFQVRAVLRQVIELTGNPSVEIEFAVATDGALILLQARPLAAPSRQVGEDEHRAVLRDVAGQITAASGPRSPAVLGARPVFGVMPDWNPAEIIGLRPRPLSLSLYRRVITDDVWARARYRYGYRDLRGVPLMVDFSGLPYVDVRASMSSLLPRDLPTSLGERLVDHWLGTLVDNPHLHDKIESRIVVSSLGLRPVGRVEELADAGFTADERRTLSASLHRLTDAMVHGPLWQRDLEQLRLLGSWRGERPDEQEQAERPDDAVAVLRAELASCVRHGTLPFAGLARAAFVATELLDDLVTEGALSPEDRAAFMAGLGTVASELRRDFAACDKAAFLKRYGHLRPGTYDILSPRYDEDPDRYFDWSAAGAGCGRPGGMPRTFQPDADRLRAIDELITRAGYSFDSRRLLTFIAEAIRGRERAKFEFTSVLSAVLTEIRRVGERLGCSAADMSYVDIGTVLGLDGGPRAARTLRQAVERGREAHATTRTIALPPLIGDPDEVWSFELPVTRPNYVTQGRVTARVADIDAGDPPRGAIALVASADPGYDWLFSQGISGLVTAFGGVNSHMAIRALELGIPSVIGVGEPLFRSWLAAVALDIDAAAGLVRVIV